MLQKVINKLSNESAKEWNFVKKYPYLYIAYIISIFVTSFTLTKFFIERDKL